jgi:hypothetical protein
MYLNTLDPKIEVAMIKNISTSILHPMPPNIVFRDIIPKTIKISEVKIKSQKRAFLCLFHIELLFSRKLLQKRQIIQL